MIFKPQKAKTYGKDKIKDIEGYWRLSKKYDGHQITIEKLGTEVVFMTSGGKQFNIEAIREPLSHLKEDFMLIGEYLYNCDGKLGSRASSTKLTTLRSDFSKAKYNSKLDEKLSIVKVFDCIPITEGLRHTDWDFYSRRYYMTYNKLLVNVSQLKLVDSHTLELADALQTVSNWVADGWEGGMLIRGDSEYMVGKRVHHAVKIKGRHTADLECYGVIPGTGKYEGLIGSLRLKDSEGRVVNVGSGLTDVGRQLTKDNYIGKVIEIQYERIDDTYIQPVFIAIRYDKTKQEID